MPGFNVKGGCDSTKAERAWRRKIGIQFPVVSEHEWPPGERSAASVAVVAGDEARGEVKFDGDAVAVLPLAHRQNGPAGLDDG